MQKISKDKLAVILAVIALVVMFAFVANINNLFPDPDKADIQNILQNTALLQNSTVTIIEFSDFQCPYCADASDTVRQLREVYGDNLNVEFRHVPMHPQSLLAAQASECARDQGKFWEYHDILFDNMHDLSKARLLEFAKEINLNSARFNACLENGEKKAVISEHLAEAKELGVRGTPTFFVGDKMIIGSRPITEFQAAIYEAVMK